MVFFSYPGNEKMAELLRSATDAAKGHAEFSRFPDGESYVRILSDVRGRTVYLVCSLNQPDDKLLSMYFFTRNARSLGAKKVCLVSPYLAYLRQDKIFRPGEALSSHFFARIISSFVDGLFTVDPHLHRIAALADIYSIPTTMCHATAPVSEWIRKNVKRPVIIGPDAESRQWVSAVAEETQAPYVLLDKVRRGDRDVQVSVPDLSDHADHTPVLVDDIISTGRTLLNTLSQLLKQGARPPVCVGIHPLFSGNSYADLMAGGAAAIVSCNTIDHPSNSIDISGVIAGAIIEINKLDKDHTIPLQGS
jgi:ribose-phosphate pyrophosphokinase